VSCKILVKMGLVVSVDNKITDGNGVACSCRVQRILSNISGCTRLIFAILSPYESALHAGDGSVPYFPICQGMLPWQPNNLSVMRQTDTMCIFCTFAKWQHCFVSLLLARGQNCGTKRAIR